MAEWACGVVAVAAAAVFCSWQAPFSAFVEADKEACEEQNAATPPAPLSPWHGRVSLQRCRSWG